jgi:hypothetical protein
MGAHRDAWLGVIVQALGAKTWEAGDGAPGGPGGDVRRAVMLPGDVLVVPANTLHLVTTPADPGWSVHLAFAVRRDLTATPPVCQDRAGSTAVR